MTARLTLLLPVRNAADTLDSWLVDAAGVADEVIALDDGSTDGTLHILRAHPIVTTVLTNPVRDTYLGWDDRENRQRLIDAALTGDPSWLMFLDADERLDSSDAQALRTFLDTEALAGFAYGFEVFRMEGDDRHFDPRAYWIFRLFSSEDAGSRLPNQTLHFVPVPSGIPLTKWLQTSIRIQHYGSVNDEHRQRRLEKYAEADPDDAFTQSYVSLLVAPGTVLPWTKRPADLPIVLGTRGRYADLLNSRPAGLDIAVTAVVIAVDDIDVIDRSITALLSQEVDEPFEVILVGSGTDGTVEHVRSQYPSVRCVQLPERVLPGGARNMGLWMARGAVITFPGSHVWLAPGSLQARLDAHDDGWDMTTCAVLNGNETKAGWASYFLDHASQLPTRQSGEFTGAPGHAAYLTEDVLRIGGFPEDMRAGEDTVVNQRLYHEGKKTYFTSEAAFYHASPSTTLRQLVWHHYKRGVGLGKIIRGHRQGRMGVRTLGRTLRLPTRRLSAMKRGMAYATPDVRRTYRSVWPLVAAGVLASATGTWNELAKIPTEEGLTADSVIPPDAPRDRPPILGISGRPGPGATGLLSFGTPRQAAQRLMTFSRMAAHETEVVPVLIPIATSATVTAEEDGNYTTRLSEAVVLSYLDAARAVGAGLMLQIQPGRATLEAAVGEWQELLARPDVGLVLDLRSHVAFDGQMDQLDEFTSRFSAASAERTDTEPLVISDGTNAVPQEISEPIIIDLSDVESKLPHDALADHPRTRALIYC
jgi:glycosyltransferase involved in cell wall biosynthesis